MSQYSPLRPRAQRQIDAEKRVQEQVKAEHHRQMVRVLEAQLHDLFRPIHLTEEVYHGAMNKPVDRSDSVTGCELTRDFTGWLETHSLIDHEEAGRRRTLEVAVDRLYQAQPYAHHVVCEHSKTGTALYLLAQRWGQSDKEVREAYNKGLDLLLTYLGGITEITE